MSSTGETCETCEHRKRIVRVLTGRTRDCLSAEEEEEEEEEVVSKRVIYGGCGVVDAAVAVAMREG